MVFVHGLGIVDHSGLAFTLGMPLATDAEVILYALRGHGHSQVVPSGYRVADHVADLLALLDAVGVHAPVHLVGCSYGGAVTVTAAARHPGRVASLFLVDPVLPVPGWVERILPMLEPAAAQLRGDYTVEDVQAALGRVPPQGGGRGRAGRAAAGAHHRPRRRAVRGAARPPRVRPHPLPGVRRVRRPLRDAAAGRGLILLVPRAPIHLVPGADHLSVFGHTRELAAPDPPARGPAGGRPAHPARRGRDT